MSNGIWTHNLWKINCFIAFVVFNNPIFLPGNYSGSGLVDKNKLINPNTSSAVSNDYINVYTIVNYTDMRVNEEYVLYYINWSRNIITGILPIASLIIFNQLVYKRLVKRRNLWKQGMKTYWISIFLLIHIYQVSPNKRYGY